jgi:1-acyl-sn-glycerol-3-phosphate acyltransferase
MDVAPEPVRRAVRGAGFAAITAAMLAPFAARVAMTPEGGAREALRDRWVRRWADALLALFAIDVEVCGHVPPGASERGRLVVANHRSTIDIAVLLRTFGGQMVSRADVSEWPLVGAAARSVGTIFVDRANASSGANTIRTVRDALRAGGTVCVFPEGTTFDGDDVRPFHAGTFVAALKTRADIVPVGLAYERGSGAAFVNEPFLAHLSRMAGARASRVAACVGEPIRVEDAARAADLRDRVHARVQALVEGARHAVDTRG